MYSAKYEILSSNSHSIPLLDPQIDCNLELTLREEKEIVKVFTGGLDATIIAGVLRGALENDYPADIRLAVMYTVLRRH